MIVVGYPRAVDPGKFRIWVGVYGANSLPTPTFTVAGNAATPIGNPVMYPIRDRMTDANNVPLNYQGIFDFPASGDGAAHKVAIHVNGAQSFELVVRSLPSDIPDYMAGSFNILLCSCYYRPNEEKRAQLNNIVSRIQLQPHLVLMSGDQVYCDLPTFENLPNSEPDFSQALANKYFQNWVPVNGMDSVGLQRVLDRAPSIFVPDDHEYWNNYPFAQGQIPTTITPSGRNMWTKAARDLYHDYQVGGDPNQANGWSRVDIGPLKILAVDMRSDRDDNFQNLMSPIGMQAITQWAADLKAAQSNKEMVVGVLTSGQALFVDKEPWISRYMQDAEMPNYQQFSSVASLLCNLVDEGIPLVYLTGDVHWSRVSQAYDGLNAADFYEVIASPSRLCAIVGRDTARQVKNGALRLIGRDDPWPRHDAPKPPPGTFGPGRRFQPVQCRGWTGDRVAMIMFSRKGNGVAMTVRSFAISENPAVSKSEDAGPYNLRKRL